MKKKNEINLSNKYIYLSIYLYNELQKFTYSKSASRYEMQKYHENSKILVNNPDTNKVNSINLTIHMNGKY